MFLAFLFLAPLLTSLGICLGTGSFAGLSWLWKLPAWYAAGFVAALILVVLFVFACAAFVDTEKPQEKENRFYRWVMYWTIELLLFLLPVRLHVTGMEKRPDTDRILLVSNHLHEIDPGILFQYFRRYNLAFIAKREALKMPLIGQFLHKTNCQTLNRENDREALKTILKCADMIRQNEHSIGVFPEGYIHDDRKLHHFRNGVFKVAQKTKVPIVVCTIQNTNHVVSNLLKLKGTDVHLHLVQVLQPEEYAGLSTVELGNRIYQLMADDLGPDRVSTDPH